MNRTDRMLAIILELQSRNRLRAEDARRKIEAVCDAKVKEEADRTRSGMRLLTTRSRAHMLETLNIVRKAVHENRKIHFNYNRSGGRERTSRTVNPYGMLFRDGTWMLVGYCHLRREMRHFLLRRMSGVELLNEQFQVPADFDLHRYSLPDHRNVVVRIRIQPHLIAWIKENHHHLVDTVEEALEEAIVTLRIRRQEDIIPWILSLGSGARVLEPDSLRQLIFSELAKMIERC